MAATAILQSEDFYERLGLMRPASSAEVSRAYRRLIRLYPPDRAPEPYRRIREAYETLIDDGARAAYNTPLPPLVRGWVERGLGAMRDRQFEAAERYFEQVLIHAPDLHYIRNLYGLSLLHQGRGADAAAEYERLFAATAPIAPWLANAARAHQLAGELDLAERACGEAVRLAQEDVAEYHAALADVHVLRGELGRAKNVLVRAIAGKEELELPEVRALLKLVEIHLLQGDDDGLMRLLRRILDTLEEGEQSRYAAWKLASLARDLLRDRRFGHALLLADSAVQLDGDPGHSALTRLATYLRDGELDGALALLDLDGAFAANGWLADLRPWLLVYATAHRTADAPPPAPVELSPEGSVFGFGIRLGRERVEQRGGTSLIAPLYLVAFGVPLFPVAAYRVLCGTEKRRHVLGRVPLQPREWLHVSAFALAAAVVVAWAAATGP